MHYLFQALDWLEPLTFALGAWIAFSVFRRCRKVGYLIIGVYFCAAIFSLLVLPRIRAELYARRAPTHSAERQQKIDAAISQAMEREGFQPEPMERNIRFPLGPLLLVAGVWLLARREPRGTADVMNTNSGFSEGGRERMRDAIDKQVRLEFQQELGATTEYWARAAIEKKIADEVKRRMKENASSQSLWGAS